MLSKELLLALIARRSDPSEVTKRIRVALDGAKRERPDLVAALPPELLALMDAYLESGIRIGYCTALLDVSDDVNGVQS